LISHGGVNVREGDSTVYWLGDGDPALTAASRHDEKRESA
jgi:hypothetical protein